MIPRATYRVQFHKGFPFSAAMPLVEYWAELGISHLYASPIATARAGSTHGYDVIDPARINPELGGEDDFRALAAALKAQGIGVILDIVPNHVAVGHGDNRWWLDVLEKGEASPFARHFDIDWQALDGKLLAPFLGVPYAEALASGVLRLDERDGKLAVIAHDIHVLPLRPEDQAERHDLDLPELHALCERQHWRLAWWRTAGDAINWRRFFDITELAGIRVEEPAVFDAMHALPLRLYAEGLIDGVRVDHVDGLADPGGYTRRLRAALEDARPGPAYLVVEKILAAGEGLPADWPVDGTSGYDFLNQVCALLHDPAAAEPLTTLWHDLSGRPADFAIEEEDARRSMVERGFAAQLDATALAFARVAASDLATRDIPQAALRRAIGWLLERFPAYRTYGTGTAAPPEDARVRNRAVREAAALAGPAEAPLVRQLGQWLAGKGPGDPAHRSDAVRRFQQLSAPIAAKAVEDTAFYRYGRLLSRNDVGCDPARLGTDAASFARCVAARAASHPHAMLATATHDHKRGEDVRARLAVLSEIPAEWSRRARRWAAAVPIAVDRGDAHMLHQMIIGAWPITLSPHDTEQMDAFAERLTGWQTKALREAKLRSAWSLPNADYEEACTAYLRRLLRPGSGFAVDAGAFAREIAPAGAAKSIVQTVLRCTLPGVPDLYQGCERWDFSLVDPDNRRPVDFAALMALPSPSPGDWRDGSIKQDWIRHLLSLRRSHPDLFADGRFEPLTIEGPRRNDALAFSRTLGDEALIVLCALRCARDCICAASPHPGADWWAGTAVRWQDRTLTAAELAGASVAGVELASRLSL
jgi:(1->4)-alpha-D-glucan 1-alpha-D-glucosylmutase